MRRQRLRRTSRHLLHTLRHHGYLTVLGGLQHIAEDTDAIGFDQVLGPAQHRQACVANVVPRVERFLDGRPAEPFFVDAGFNETHKIGPGGRCYPSSGNADENVDPRYVQPPACLPNTPETRLDMARYRTDVAVFDHGVGAILDALERNGLADNTLVLLTTDHGLPMPRMKRTLSDGGIGVMLVMRGPCGFQGGRVVDGLVSHVDVFPTLCDWLDIPRPDWLQGVSFLPLVEGTAERTREHVFAELTYHCDYVPKRGVRSERYEYVRLYDANSPQQDGVRSVRPARLTLYALPNGNTIEQTVGCRPGPGIDGRASFYVHRNPANRILHTALVGDMNGFLHAMSIGTPCEEQWGRFGGARAYTPWIQPAPASAATAARPGIPPRPDDAIGGRAFMESIAALRLADREATILHELANGNLPDFLRRFTPVRVAAVAEDGTRLTAEYTVMPDYLAVGSDSDFVRVPMTPQTAQKLAIRFGCCLPTRKMVDDTDAHAAVRLAPRPMTEERESVATFVAHHDLVEAQRGQHPLGALVCGIKKDIVITNRLAERPRRVAIYGWRKLDGTPIQPLTIVHCDTYVDYSHGVRLVSRSLTVGGVRRSVDEVLTDRRQCVLLSDEGPILVAYGGSE